MKRIRRLLTIFGKRALFQVRVSGESCWPVLVPGRSYWASALMSVRTGDFIVFGTMMHPEKNLVKKVTAIRENGYEVGSTVSWGLSSEDFGIIDKRNVLGKIVRWNNI